MLLSGIIGMEFEWDELRRTMGTTRIRIEPGDPATFPEGRIDAAKVDGTTEVEIGLQQREDDADAMKDAARYGRKQGRSKRTEG